MKKLSAILASLTMLSACMVNVKNGTLEAEHVEDFQDYTGSYHTSIRGEEGTIRLRIDGNRPYVTVSGFHGGDVMGNDCESSVHEITSFDLKSPNDNPWISYMNFRLDPGECGGINSQHRLVISFHKNGEFKSAYVTYNSPNFDTPDIDIPTPIINPGDL